MDPYDEGFEEGADRAYDQGLRDGAASAGEELARLRAEVERLRCEMGWCAKVLRERVATKYEVADHIDRALSRGDGAS